MLRQPIFEEQHPIRSIPVVKIVLQHLSRFIKKLPNSFGYRGVYGVETLSA